MGVLAYGDAHLIEKVKILTEEGSFSVGLVIAGKNEENYYLTHLAPLSDVEDIESESNEKNAESKKVVKPASISALPEVALTLHASQVVRMLPGGLDIFGIYVIAPMAEINNLSNQGKLRGILSSIHKLTSSYVGTGEESSLEKLVLYGCTQSSKIGIKSIDLSEHGTSLVSGNLKTQDNKWIQLDYNYSLSFPIYFPTEKNAQSLRKNVVTYLQSWAHSLKNIIILIDGKMFDEDTEIDVSEDQSKKKTKYADEKSLLTVFNAEILENQNKSEARSISEFQECYGSAMLSGNVTGRAFINGKAKASIGFAAIKNDLIRTMYSRWEMHCDSLVEEPHGSLTEPVLHEPPRRVFLKGGNSVVSLCDYLFPGDSVSDACQSARELFDIVIEESDVNDALESWADPTEFRTSETTTSPFGSEIEKISSVKHFSAVQFCLALVIGISAMVIAYYIMILKR